jgi:hypothetical protein
MRWRLLLPLGCFLIAAGTGFSEPPQKTDAPKPEKKATTPKPEKQAGPPKKDAGKDRGRDMLARSGLKAGMPLPDVTVYDAEGKEFMLRSLRGHYIVFVFGCLS